MTKKPLFHEVMRSEVIADCYGGDTCDQVSTKFRTYCDGDMDSDEHRDDITIRLADLPAGAVVSVSYPCCPECGTPRQDTFEHLKGGSMRRSGHEPKCSCGFDWEDWILEKYS